MLNIDQKKQVIELFRSVWNSGIDLISERFEEYKIQIAIESINNANETVNALHYRKWAFDTIDILKSIFLWLKTKENINPLTQEYNNQSETY